MFYAYQRSLHALPCKLVALSIPGRPLWACHWSLKASGSFNISTRQRAAALGNVFVSWVIKEVHCNTKTEILSSMRAVQTIVLS